MNRRDLFKRAGKLGAGLGLAAVVGTTLREGEPEVRSGFSQPEGYVFASRSSTTTRQNPTLILGTPNPVTEGGSGVSQPAWTVRQNVSGTPSAVPSGTFDGLGEFDKIWVRAGGAL